MQPKYKNRTVFRASPDEWGQSPKERDAAHLAAFIASRPVFAPAQSTTESSVRKSSGEHRKASRRATIIASQTEIALSLEKARAMRDSASERRLRALYAAAEKELEALPAAPHRAQSDDDNPCIAAARAAAQDMREQARRDTAAALIQATHNPAPQRDWRGEEK